MSTARLGPTRRGFLYGAGAIGGTLLFSDFDRYIAHAAEQGKDVLRVATESEMQFLRPDIWGSWGTFSLMRNIYTQLYVLGTAPRNDGSGAADYLLDEGKLDYRLATSHTITPDRMQITFTIRKGAKFANGDPLNAHGAKAHFDWVHDNGDPGHGQLGVDGLPGKDNIVVLDDYTLQFNLDRPVAWGVTSHFMLISDCIVHAEEIRKHATAEDPTGKKWAENNTIESGPYMIERWDRGQQMILTANPNYFAPPKVSKIILQNVPDASTRRALIEKGDVDYALYLARKDSKELMNAPGVKVISAPGQKGWFVGMTYLREPFTDLHVRKAVAHAIPYEDVYRVSAHGLADVGKSVIPNNCSGYNGAFWTYEYDLDKAREHLAMSSVPNGFETTMPLDTAEPLHEEAAVVIQESLAKIGIKMNIQKMPAPQQFELLLAKKVDMAVYEWHPWMPDAGYYIFWTKLPESYSDYWGWANEEAQTAGRDAITMPVGSPERQAKLDTFQRIAAEQVECIPLFTEYDLGIMRDHVMGYVHHPDGLHDYYYLSHA